MRLSGTKTGAINQYRGLGNQLWDLAGNRPSLDLPFADNKSLVDATTGANLVDFTRASSGTYVDSEGVIRTATTNLILQSENLQAGQWGVTGSGATITATTDFPAPNGTMTAWTLTSSGAFAQIQQAPAGISGATYTGSFWIRRRSGTGTVNIRVSENTNIPLVGVTSEWQRFSFAATSTSTTIRLGVNLSGTADAVDIWGAQLEQSTTVGEYIPTTSTINSAPRFDHNPTTGESLGLLVEEQKTNLCLQSEDISTSWGYINSTEQTNTIISPAGTLTGDKLIENTALGEHYVNSSNASWVGNTQYTASVYLKAGERTRAQLQLGTSANWVNGERTANFDLSAGTVVTFPGSPASASIISVGNGWYRCTLTATTVASPSGSGFLVKAIESGTTTSYTGDGTSGIYLWGAQLEAGSFPTSYIPTTTAAATRAADVASISGSNFSSWASSGKGTIYGESIGSGPLMTLRSVASASNRVQVAVGSSAVVVDGSVVASSSNTTAVKRVMAYELNNTNWAYDGSLAVLDDSCTIPILEYATIGYFDFGGALRNNGTISRLTFWPTRLPDSTLQTITQ
jgi:hypothetical protein